MSAGTDRLGLLSSPGKISRARARSVQVNVAVLFARRLVCFTSLNCMFPNLEDFILGQQTSELYVLENVCCYYNARNCCCGTRIRNIKDHQHTPSSQPYFGQPDNQSAGSSQ